MEGYKKTEQRIYEDLYKHEMNFVDSSVRNTILVDSEVLFFSLIEKFTQSSNQEILEVGCGIDPAILRVKPEQQKICLVDLSLEGLRVAKTRAEHLGLSPHCIQMDAEKLAFQTSTFDCVVDNEFLSSVEPVKALQEIARVLKPGGILICKETLGHNPIFSYYRRVKVKRGDMHSWVADHIFETPLLESINDVFILVEIHYFHLLSILAGSLLLRLNERSLPGRLLHSTVNSVD